VDTTNFALNAVGSKESLKPLAEPSAVHAAAGTAAVVLG